MEVDYLILGQGICGSLLSYELLKQGKSVMVIDDNNSSSSSRVASGLINPVTGKRHVKAWEYDSFLSTALDTYRDLEKLLDVTLIQETDIIQFHASQAEKAGFEERIATEPAHLSSIDTRHWQPYFTHNFGGGRIAPCYIIDGTTLLAAWRQRLLSTNALKTMIFSWDECVVDKDHVRWGDITAGKLICCDGTNSLNNPYFSLLPFSLNKGEVAIVSIPGLPPSSIYKQHYKIVTLKEQLFWVGSSFLWKYSDLEPSVEFKDNVAGHLRNWLKLPFEIQEIQASERPSTVDYRPFVGLHPLHPSIGILNGMGTKGYSQAPLFAKQLSDQLCEGEAVMQHADVSRFKSILARL